MTAYLVVLFVVLNADPLVMFEYIRLFARSNYQ